MKDEPRFDLDNKATFSYMGLGQYLVYSSQSSIFEECITVFNRFPGFGIEVNMIVIWKVYDRFPSPSPISNNIQMSQI